jgi:DNA-binding IclR family transcriptional regulator
MKEYRLAAWPELRGPHARTAYRRMLSDMSHRHMTVWQLVAASGLRRLEVQNFLDMLKRSGLLIERNRSRLGLGEHLAPLACWLRRSWSASLRGD